MDQSFRAYRFVLLLSAVAGAGPALAATRQPTSLVSPETLYVRARAADMQGMTALAATGYAQVLAASPNDGALAARTYRQALAAGDRTLALRAAHILEASGALPPDARLLFLGEALLASDWRAAGAQIDRIQADGVFAFAVPVMRAWVAQGARSGDPLAILEPMRSGGPTAAGYAAEHGALLMLARGQYDQGVAAIKTLVAANGDRPIRLRFAAAATLAGAGKRDLALSLLQGDDATLAAARDRIEHRRPLDGAVEKPAEGIAELYDRLGSDVNRDRVSPLGLALARLASFLAPHNASGWVVVAEMLAANEQYDTALGVLDHVSAEDPMFSAARDARVQILMRNGNSEEALREASAVAAAAGATPGDWARVGEIQAGAKRFGDAVQAYQRAYALAEHLPDDGTRWTLLLLLGSAQHDAGDWPASKATLERALAIAPDQPSLLNFLGYSQLERRENLDGAQRLIQRASELRPDDAAITNSLGWTYFVRGDVPKAIEMLERANAAQPGEPTIAEHLGDAYWSAGRRLEARFAWNSALAYAEDASKSRLRAKLDFGLTRETTAP